MTVTNREAVGGVRTVVFLDVDRVLSPIHETAAWADMVRVDDAPFPNVHVSPGLLGRLGALDAVLVFVTDWQDAAVLFERFLGRQVPYLPWVESAGWWKHDAIVSFLGSHPEVTRVVVADDHLTRRYDDGSNNAARLIAAIDPAVQVLLVAPEDGLTADELAGIEAFVNQN